MRRLPLLAVSLLALAGSTSDGYSFRQRGTVPAPRAALHDGRPMSGAVRIEGHAGTLTATEAAGDSAAGSADSGAAIAAKQAGGALRLRAGKGAFDIGIEVDRAWDASKTTRDGVRIAAPEEHVIDTAFSLRTASRVDDAGDTRVGFVANLGGHSVPILRGSDPPDRVRRNTSLLFRAALVPSHRSGAVTFFGSIGVTTEADVPSTAAGPGADPGAVAENSGVALTVAAGARVDLGGGTHMTACVGDAFTHGAPGHYGPQVDIGVGVDIGN